MRDDDAIAVACIGTNGAGGTSPWPTSALMSTCEAGYLILFIPDWPTDASRASKGQGAHLPVAFDIASPEKVHPLRKRRLACIKV